MKRAPRKQGSTYRKHTIAIDPARYSTVRGGIDIAVRVTEAPAAYMSLQHNELLITQ